MKNVAVQVPAASGGLTLNTFFAYNPVVVESIAAGPAYGVFEVGDVLQSINRTQLGHTSDPVETCKEFIKATLNSDDSIIVSIDQPLRKCSSYLLLEQLLLLGVTPETARTMAAQLRFVNKASVAAITPPVKQDVARILESCGLPKKELLKLRRSKATLWGANRWGKEEEEVEEGKGGEEGGASGSTVAIEMSGAESAQDPAEDGRKLPAWKRAALKLNMQSEM